MTSYDTPRTIFDTADIRRVLKRVDAGDERAREILHNNARDWLWSFLAMAATDRAVIREHEAHWRADPKEMKS